MDHSLKMALRKMPRHVIHSIAMCTMRRFLAVLKNFFHYSLLYTPSFHPFPPTIRPSSLTSSCHLFLGLPLNLVVPKFIYNTLLGIVFSSILSTCPNQYIYKGNSISKLQIVIEKNRMEIMTYKQHLFFNIISIQI